MSSQNNTTKQTTITFTYNGKETTKSIGDFSPCSKCNKVDGTVEHCGATIFPDDHASFYQCLGDRERK